MSDFETDIRNTHLTQEITPYIINSIGFLHTFYSVQNYIFTIFQVAAAFLALWRQNQQCGGELRRTTVGLIPALKTGRPNDMLGRLFKSMTPCRWLVFVSSLFSSSCRSCPVLLFSVSLTTPTPTPRMGSDWGDGIINREQSMVGPTL